MHGLPCSALLEPLQPLRERQERAAEEGKGGGDHEDRLYSGGSSDLAGRERISQRMWERREREMWPGFENRIPRPPHKHEAWGEWGAGAWKRATCAKWAPRGGRGARGSGYALWLCLQRLKMGPTVVLPDGDPVWYPGPIRMRPLWPMSVVCARLVPPY